MPRNEVSALLHMSGECLCGAFAHEGELDEIGDWSPDVAVGIRALEEEALAAGIPPERCRWGWGAGRERPSRTGPMCSSCDARSQQMDLFGIPAPRDNRRARINAEQADVVVRMQELGHNTWHRATLGKIERGERKVSAGEVISLAEALDVPVCRS